MTSDPFKPITRELAAEILAVSLSTLDALIASGAIPRPIALGDLRRVYWHPDIFYGALHRALGVPEGKNIPAKKLNQLANSSNPTTARQANLAKTLKKLGK